MKLQSEASVIQERSAKTSEARQLEIPVTPKKREKKKAEPIGSRWAGVMLLFLTICISLLFYTKGKISEGTFDVSGAIDGVSKQLFGQQTYRFEK